MGIINDYKKLGFSRDLIYLYAGKLCLDFGNNILNLFLSIFLFEQFGNIYIVIVYFALGSLAYFLSLPLFARLLGSIGVRNSLLISVFMRMIYFGAFYKFVADPWLYLSLAFTSEIFIRNFFWLPFHVETAELADKSNRGKQMGVIFSLASLLGVIAPVVAGFILERWNFSVLALISLVITALSLIAFYFIKPNKEEFCWSYRETFKYFFHPFNRHMVMAYMSDGIIGAVNLIFWPLFIFMLLDERYQAVGLITGGIILAGIILRLVMGNLLDHFQKRNLVKIGTFLNSSAWLIKVAIASAFQIFVASIYHTLGMIVLRTSLDTLVYEKAADRGHYVDEYTVIKEMAIHLGKITALLLVGILLIFFPLQVSFILAAIASIFINLLR